MVTTILSRFQAAYKLWDEAFKAGDVDVDAATRWAQSGQRILTNLFGVGLYDNPFQDLEESKAIVGNEEAVQAGLDAQHESVVVVKNQDSTIKCEAPKDDYKKMKVYIPRAFDTGHNEIFGEAQYTEARRLMSRVAKQYFGEVVTDRAVTDADDKVTSYTARSLRCGYGHRWPGQPEQRRRFRQPGPDREGRWITFMVDCLPPVPSLHCRWRERSQDLDRRRH